jgi:hypothetical protein
MSYLVRLEDWGGKTLAEVSFNEVPVAGDCIEIETLLTGEENAHIDKGPVKLYAVTARKWLAFEAGHYTTVRGSTVAVLLVEDVTEGPEIPWE